MDPRRWLAPGSLRLTLASAAMCALVLTGCAADADPSPVQQQSQESPGAQTAQASADDAAAKGGTTPSLPSSFPSQVPLLPYDITDVRASEEAREYRIRMLGTAAQSDAETARAQFKDAGFTETIWNDVREGQWSGLFELDGLVAKVDVRDAEAGVEIEYNVGQH